MADTLFDDAPAESPSAKPPRARPPRRTRPERAACANCEREYTFRRRGLCRSCYRELPEELRATFDDLRSSRGFDSLPPRDRLRILRSKMSERTDVMFREVFAEPRLSESEALARAFGTPVTTTKENP